MPDEVRTEYIGTVTAVHVSPGRVVTRGETLVVVESMKMEFPIEAPRSGTVVSVSVREQDNVNIGDVLVTLE